MVLGLSNNDIKVKLGVEKNCVQKISVEMPVFKVQEKIEEGFKNVQSRVKLPGFRPGKAPIEKIRASYQDAAYDVAQDLLLREGVNEALRTKNLNPVRSPVVNSVQFDPKKPFQFEFEVEISPTIKATGYKGLKLTRDKKKIADEDVTKAIQELANMNARLVESKAESLGGTHFAIINYEGFLDGQPISGAKAENFLLDMSAPQAISGLAEGLSGAKPNDEREVLVTFPADSPAKELAGKQAVFKVKLLSIKEKTLPALDDEFAKDLGVETMETLRKQIRENLENEAKQASNAKIEQQVIDAILQANAFAVPKSQIENQITNLLERQRNRFMSDGKLRVPQTEMDKFLERIKPDVEKQAERDVRLAYILNAIADQERIEATEAEITSKIDAILAKSSPKERGSLEKTLKNQYTERLKTEIREQKLFTWLIDNAKIKEE